MNKRLTLYVSLAITIVMATVTKASAQASEVDFGPIQTIFVLLFVAALPIIVLLWVIDRFLEGLGYDGVFRRIFRQF